MIMLFGTVDHSILVSGLRIVWALKEPFLLNGLDQWFPECGPGPPGGLWKYCRGATVRGEIQSMYSCIFICIYLFILIKGEAKLLIQIWVPGAGGSHIWLKRFY